jgi:hypothetical protein
MILNGERFSVVQNWEEADWSRIRFSQLETELPRDLKTGGAGDSKISRKRVENRPAPVIRVCMSCAVSKEKSLEECKFNSYYGERICPDCHYAMATGAKRYGRMRSVKTMRQVIRKPLLNGK